MKRIRAVQFGCGPIGCGVATLAAERAEIELVGALDIDRRKVGRDLGEVAGLAGKLGIAITEDWAALIARTKPDIVFHATGSAFRSVYDQIAGLVASGLNVVSTCEELCFPVRREPELASRLDGLARRHDVSVLATGINPGFLMDTWPLCMTGVCQRVERVRGVRIQDASMRRLPFQQKIGAGLTPDAFRQEASAGRIRHVGLSESIAMIAAGLGWELSGIEEEIEPVLAEEEVRSQHLTVKPGRVAGVRQVGRGLCDRRAVISLEFQAFLGAPESLDRVSIIGTPDLEVVIRGGVQGDLGTAAMVVNSARRVVEAPPGLLTMMDMPLITCASASSPSPRPEID